MSFPFEALLMFIGVLAIGTAAIAVWFGIVVPRILKRVEEKRLAVHKHWGNALQAEIERVENWNKLVQISSVSTEDKSRWNRMWYRTSRTLALSGSPEEFQELAAPMHLLAQSLLGHKLGVQEPVVGQTNNHSEPFAHYMNALLDYRLYIRNGLVAVVLVLGVWSGFESESGKQVQTNSEAGIHNTVS